MINDYVIVTLPVHSKHELESHIKQLEKHNYKYEVRKNETGKFYLVREILDDDPIEITSLFVPQRQRGETKKIELLEKGE